MLVVTGALIVLYNVIWHRSVALPSEQLRVSIASVSPSVKVTARASYSYHLVIENISVIQQISLIGSSSGCTTAGCMQMHPLPVTIPPNSSVDLHVNLDLKESADLIYPLTIYVCIVDEDGTKEHLEDIVVALPIGRDFLEP